MLDDYPVIKAKLMKAQTNSKIFDMSKTNLVFDNLIMLYKAFTKMDDK